MCQHFSGCCTDKALKQRRTTKFLHWGAAEEPAGSCGVPEDRAGLWTEAVGPHSTHSPGLVFVPMCMCCAKSLQSCLTLCSPLDSGPPGYMGFSGQEYWSGLPCHPSGDLPDPEIEPASLMSSALAGGCFATFSHWRGHLSSLGFPSGSVIKTLPAMQETRVWSLGCEDSPGGGNGDPLQYFYLENPMDRGAWQGQSMESQHWTRLKQLSTHACKSSLK